LLSLAFLLHDSLVSTDAIWRTLYRRMVSRRRLLEWETSAEAELGSRRLSPLEYYLRGTPVLALAIGIIVFFLRCPGLWSALPILMLWSGSKVLSLWLDRPPCTARRVPSISDRHFLRFTALRTWRYFAEFSNQEHNWLIPDNVQEEPLQVAARVSPTNLGLLLNARQVACEMGYLSVPEFSEQTRRTLWTMARMQTFRGHLLNWYDTRTLAVLEPVFVSTVDSGNLAASLITLKGGTLALLQKPLLSHTVVDACEDLLLALVRFGAISHRKVRRIRGGWQRQPLLPRILDVISTSLPELQKRRTAAEWFSAELHKRKEWMERILSDYMPWLLPEFASLRDSLGMDSLRELEIPLCVLPTFIRALQARCEASVNSLPPGERDDCIRLSTRLGHACRHSTALIENLHAIAAEAERWFARMDFSFLVDPRRKLLSIGYDVSTGVLQPASYDLLASEARTAAFLGIARGDLSQQTWFLLGRAHSPTRGGPALVSWAGTMFEYLMPSLWMKSHRDTLLTRSLQAAVAAQQAFAREKGVPWGISESGYGERESDGAYRYRAFGIPELALQEPESPRLVVTPYASALALAMDPASAVTNLRRMAKLGWTGAFGFYEAVDFDAQERRGRCQLVKSWMAHHQGMILLAIANHLCGNIVQDWFHSDVRVEATELLLQERRVLRHVRPAWHTKTPRLPRRVSVA
jgi:hypothetical protein